MRITETWMSERFFYRKLSYAIDLHNEVYSWEYITEDLAMEISFERPMTESQAVKYAKKIVKHAIDIVEFEY